MRLKIKSMYFFSVIALMFMTPNVYADNNAIIYENAVKDTLAIGSRYVKDIDLITNQNVNIVLNGYGAVLNVSSFPEFKIIQASAIGLKNGLDIKYIKFNNNDYIVFSVENREADALFLIERLSKYGLSPTVEKLNGSYQQTLFVANDLIKSMNDTLIYLTSKKDDTIAKLNSSLNGKGRDCPEIQPIVIPKNQVQPQSTNLPNSNNGMMLDLSSLQVINKVVTTDYLRKYNINENSVEPFTKEQKAKLTPEKVKTQINLVTKNVKNDSQSTLPEIDNFSQAYLYLKEHGAITKENYLVLHKKAYKVGDNLFIWKITNINYNLGVVVLGNDYTIPLKKN